MAGDEHTFTDKDHQWMRLALRLAVKGKGRTSPNPMVGAVLIQNGRAIGKGYHRRAGEPHAEIEAIADATQRGQDVRGSTLYVTLEPCSTIGVTPPCTDAIIKAGCTEVVFAAKDPNPRHHGKAACLLRAQGVRVREGLMQGEAEELNKVFRHFMETGYPYTIAKIAMSLDGRIATKTGESKWITNAKARQRSMKLREHSTAIMVGINTVLIDDPHLTIRKPKGEMMIRQPPLIRVVVDSKGRLPPAARVLRHLETQPTLIVTALSPRQSKHNPYPEAAEMLHAPSTQNGQVDLHWTLKKLASLGLNQLLVEGGGELHASLFQERLIQAVEIFIAPRIIGGRDAPRAVGGTESFDLDKHSVRLVSPRWKRLEDNLHLSSEVAYGS